MKRPPRVAFLALALVGYLQAQSAPTPAPHAPSGGTRETVMSIYIPPLANAPFTATVNTEWTRALEDGSTTTVFNQRIVARDSAGRIYEQRATFVPKFGERQPTVWRLEFVDPAAHRRYVCLVQTRTCDPTPYAGVVLTKLPTPGPLPAGRGDMTREALGTDMVTGVEAIGSRETTVLNTGVIGNDRPLSITREFWYSPRLGINLVEKRNDPRFGLQSFAVTNINLSEPDPKYFAIPEGFTLAKGSPARQTR